MIDWKFVHKGNQLHFSSQYNQQVFNFTHDLYFSGNYRFLHIQKNASTTMRFIMQRPLKIIDKPYYFTVLRNPLERFKSTLYYNNIEQGWSVFDQGQELMNFKNRFNDYEWFCHFIPQHLHLQPFLKNGTEIDYWSIDKLPYLCKKILTKMCHIGKTNNTNPNKELIQQVDEWINNNQKFVDEFLAEDNKLFSSKILN